MTISDILNELGIPIAPAGHHHTTEGWKSIDCPHCSPRAGKFRLGIPPNPKGTVNCWTCGIHRLWETLSEASSVPISEVSRLLGNLPASEGERPVKRILERKGRLQMPGNVLPMAKAHKRYLKRERKLDPDEIEKLWGVRGIGIDSRLPWRLFIPIRDGGETVSWTTRAISDEVDQRYLTASPKEEKVSSRDVLYGSELARHAIVVCEGPIDAWTVGCGGVATLGTGYSRSQLLLMANYPVRVICFDRERDAQKRAANLRAELELFDGSTHNVVLESGKDANSADRREIKQLRKRFLK